MRRRLAAVALAVITAVALTGCGPENKDPRIGKVVIEESNCLFGDCYQISKVCQGPDLVYRNTDLDDEHRERIVKDSEECTKEFK